MLLFLLCIYILNISSLYVGTGQIVLGTTGEGSTVSHKERIEIIKLARNVIGNKAKLIVVFWHMKRYIIHCIITTDRLL